MTATIKPRNRDGKSRPIRFSAMESLGFSNPSSVWTDSPQGVSDLQPVPTREPDTVADWQPEDFGTRLNGRDFRWGLALTGFAFFALVAGFGYWLYQRPASQAEASVVAVNEGAENLSAALPDLEQFNETLTQSDSAAETSLLSSVDAAARELFNVSGELPGSETATRSAAAAASSAALDGVRLAGDAHAYRLAVTPLLAAPELETDPNIIELDEAARTFGEWQLHFDDVRSALPDGVLPDVTEQLDVFSGDLTTMLGNYVDALREDDSMGAANVLRTVSTQLELITAELDTALAETHSRVSERIAEARASLESLLSR